MWWPREHGPGPWEEMLGAVYGEGRWPEIARTEPEEERLVSAVAEGAGVSFIMLERSRTLRIPGAVFRRFTTPEPTVGHRAGLAPRRRPAGHRPSARGRRATWPSGTYVLDEYAC